MERPVEPHRCTATTQAGKPCPATPLRARPFCIMHDPDHAEEVQEARRLGGLRRRREAKVQGAYDVTGLRTPEDIRRVIEIAVLDTLAMENSVARSRTLAHLAMAALKALELGEYELRIAALERALQMSQGWEPSVFDQVIDVPGLPAGMSVFDSEITREPR